MKTLSQAAREVSSKSDSTVEAESARAWMLRAIACYRKYAETGRVAWLVRAKGYDDEAREHAALARDGGELLRAVEARLDAMERKVAHRTKSGRHRYGA